MTVRNVVVDGSAPVWAKHLETDLNGALTGLTSDLTTVGNSVTALTTQLNQTVSVTNGHARIGTLLLQWGQVATGTGDQFINFPVAFTVGTTPTVTATASYFCPGNEGAYVLASLVDNTRFYGQPRFENSSGVTAMSTSIPWQWMAIGI